MLRARVCTRPAAKAVRELLVAEHADEGPCELLLRPAYEELTLRGGPEPLEGERRGDARHPAGHRLEQLVLDPGPADHGTGVDRASREPRPDVPNLSDDLDAVELRQGTNTRGGSPSDQDKTCVRACSAYAGENAPRQVFGREDVGRVAHETREDDSIRVAGRVRVGCVEIDVDSVRNDSHVEGRIDLAKGVPVGIADNDEPIEPTVFRCDVARDADRGPVGESSSERREPAGADVDDIGSKGVELIAERSAQQGGEAVGSQRSPCDKCTKKCACVLGTTRLRTRDESQALLGTGIRALVG